MKTENPSTIKAPKPTLHQTTKFLKNVYGLTALFLLAFIGGLATIYAIKYEQLEEKLVSQKKESFKIINSQYKVLNEMKDEIEELKSDTTWLRYLLNKKK
jgi:hypothetical protein